MSWLSWVWSDQVIQILQQEWEHWPALSPSPPSTFTSQTLFSAATSMAPSPSFSKNHEHCRCGESQSNTCLSIIIGGCISSVQDSWPTSDWCWAWYLGCYQDIFSILPKNINGILLLQVLSPFLSPRSPRCMNIPGQLPITHSLFQLCLGPWKIYHKEHQFPIIFLQWPLTPIHQSGSSLPEYYPASPLFLNLRYYWNVCQFFQYWILLQLCQWSLCQAAMEALCNLICTVKTSGRWSRTATLLSSNVLHLTESQQQEVTCLAWLLGQQTTN